MRSIPDVAEFDEGSTLGLSRPCRLAGSTGRMIQIALPGNGSAQRPSRPVATDAVADWLPHTRAPAGRMRGGRPPESLVPPRGQPEPLCSTRRPQTLPGPEEGVGPGRGAFGASLLDVAVPSGWGLPASPRSSRSAIPLKGLSASCLFSSSN